MSIPISQIELLSNLLAPKESKDSKDSKELNQSDPNQWNPSQLISQTMGSHHSKMNYENTSFHGENNYKLNSNESATKSNNSNTINKNEEHSKIITKHKVIAQDAQKIWEENEVPEETENYYNPNESREIPEYDILYKQQVGTQNVYFGMDSTVHPGSTGCSHIIVSIKLPRCDNASQLTLDVKSRSLKLASKIYFLHIPLPHIVDQDNGNAQWIKASHTLKVTLPLTKYEVDL